MKVIRHRPDAGFTLVELMIVVAIIGLLVSLALPRFQNHVMRTRQIEAEELLANLRTAQLMYFAQNNAFAADESGLGIAMDGDRRYSAAVFTNVTGRTYTATISANLDDDVSLDRWQITESGPSVHLCNDVTNLSDTGNTC